MLPRHALVLTAGLGTRLRPLTSLRAKPALPVAGDALARRIIRSLAAQGVCDLVLNLHYLPHTITAVVGDGSDLGARVRYSWEQPTLLGSAGGPRHALSLMADETFFVINGDTLTDVDLRTVAERHRASGALVTLALVPNFDPLRYGGVLVDKLGAVTGFVSRGPAATGSYHFIGVQVVEGEVFASLADNEPARSIGGVYDTLIREQPRSVGACIVDARFWDIGTPADYLSTSLAFAAAERGSHLCCGANVHVDDSARVVDSVLWDDVSVGAGCHVSRCIITNGVRLAPGSHHNSAILLQGRDALMIEPLS